MTTSDNSSVPDYLASLRLDQKNFIVLGAGQGMGRQTCHALHQGGARILCVDVDEHRANEIAAEVSGIPWQADCTQRDDIQKLVDVASRRLGPVSGFVDIIGLALWGSLLDMDDASWDRQFDIVLRHAYLMAQIAGRHMRENGGGSMVFIASISGLSGAPNHAAYGAAKAGLMSWVRSIALELGPHGIRANAVAPGTVVTPRRGNAKYSEEQQAEIARTIPLGRRGKTSEIASAALFLSSPLASYISGQTIVVDGGLICRFPVPV